MQGECIWKNKQHEKFIGTPCTAHGARLFGGVGQNEQACLRFAVPTVYFFRMRNDFFRAFALKLKSQYLI
jgi:hypothetical protein